MLKITRLAAIGAFALVLAAFQDAANTYTIDFPEGWELTPGAPEGGFQFAKAPDGMTNCGAKSGPVPQSASMTQEQINAEMASVFDASGWANMLGTPVTNVTGVTAELRDVEGKAMQIATLDMAAGFENIPVPTKLRLGFIMVPGKVVLGNCMTTPEKFGEFEQTFEATVSSLRPL